MDAIEADKEGVLPSEVVMRETKASRATRARKAATPAVRLSTSVSGGLVPPSESGGDGPQLGTPAQKRKQHRNRTSINGGKVLLASGEEAHVLFGGLIARLEDVIRDRTAACARVSRSRGASSNGARSALRSASVGTVFVVLVSCKVVVRFRTHTSHVIKSEFRRGSVRAHTAACQPPCSHSPLTSRLARDSPQKQASCRDYHDG